MHFIGYGMKRGEIHVHGNAGRHVGGEMSGGRIEVDGNAGDWVGGEMHGGLIHVAGNAGHWIGAAYRGSKKGMTDGTILIGGDVGSEVGASMRRGTLAVGGSCGDAAGFNMIAGSILVFGSCGIRPAPACGEGRSASSARNRPGCCQPSGPPAASGRFFFDSSSASWLDSVSRSTDGLLDSRAVALSWRSGRPGQGRGLDENAIDAKDHGSSRPTTDGDRVLQDCRAERSTTRPTGSTARCATSGSPAARSSIRRPIPRSGRRA